MQRIPEPELMDDAAQARAYAEADFDEANSLFMDLFAERFPAFAAGHVLDLGCGPGDITIRFATRYPQCSAVGVDGAGAMLRFGNERLADDPAGGRVRFVEGLVPGVSLPRARYDAVISNSLLHHLHEPRGLWDTVIERAAAAAPVLVMDLRRPPDAQAARDLVDRYAADAPAVLRTDFYNSLLAAFELDEVRDQLASVGLGRFEVAAVSDRHLAVWGHAPGA